MIRFAQLVDGRFPIIQPDGQIAFLANHGESAFAGIIRFTQFHGLKAEQILCLPIIQVHLTVPPCVSSVQSGKLLHHLLASLFRQRDPHSRRFACIVVDDGNMFRVTLMGPDRLIQPFRQKTGCSKDKSKNCTRSDQLFRSCFHLRNLTFRNSYPGQVNPSRFSLPAV